MYTDKRKRRWPLALSAGVLLILVIVGVWLVSRRSSQDIQEEAALALKAAISQSALQCYVVEGFYPPTLEHLEENYGLQVNREDFYVRYEAFASNLPPDVAVAPRP